jgi:hypothetical protein
VMPYGCPWPSPQLTGHADLGYPTRRIYFGEDGRKHAEEP